MMPRPRSRSSEFSWSPRLDDSIEREAYEGGIDMCRIIKCVFLMSLFLVVFIVSTKNNPSLQNLVECEDIVPDIQCILCNMYLCLLHILLKLMALVELFCKCLLNVFNCIKIEITRVIQQTHCECPTSCFKSASKMISRKT
ncbi:uncharacterized protein LOC134800017 [Cydia splendana]|uniref:uncharacterized protein LOC134800017 n=1 Tax=Cydia splendana TaxID=1100963 RepID=UPI0028F4C2AE